MNRFNRIFTDGSRSNNSRFGNASAFRRSNALDQEVLRVESGKSISEYEKASRLLNTTNSHALNIFPQEKLDILNKTTFHAVTKGYQLALAQLSKQTLTTPNTYYAMSEEVYEAEISRYYEEIENALSQLQEIEPVNFNAETYLSNLNTILGSLSSSTSPFVREAADLIRNGFANGVIGYYEKEGLSNPRNIFEFFNNLSLTGDINNLIEGIDLDPTNPEHHTLLMLAYELYHLKFNDYRSNPNNFITDLETALRSYGDHYVEEDSDVGKCRSALYGISDKILNRIGDENFMDQLADFKVLETSMNNLVTSNLHATFDTTANTYSLTEEYSDNIKKLNTDVQRFNLIKSTIEDVVAKLGTLNITPALSLDTFIEPTNGSFTFKTLSERRDSIIDSTLEYPIFKFKSIQEFQDIIKNLGITNTTTSTIDKFQSLESMTASIAKFIAQKEFTEAGIPSPSTKSLDLVTSSKIAKFNLKAKFRSSIEDFGARSQGLENLNIPLKSLSFNEALNFAIQNVLRKHPDVDAKVLRTACQASTVQEFDRLLQKSHRMIDPDVISYLIANMHSIYSGHLRSLDEKGNECILGIQETDFSSLQRQIGVFTSGYTNYLATSIQQNLPRGLSEAEKNLRITQECNAIQNKIVETAAILSYEGVALPDTLMQLKNSTRDHVDRLIDSGLSFKQAEKIAQENGFKMGTYGYYTKTGYRSRRFARGTKNVIGKVSGGSMDYVVKPLFRLGVGTLDLVTFNRFSKYSRGIWNVISGKKNN